MNTSGSIKRDRQIVSIKTTEKVVKSKKVYSRKTKYKNELETHIQQ